MIFIHYYTRRRIAEAMLNAPNEARLRERLRASRIDLYLRRNATRRITGVTFIDHDSRTVLNDSPLGKEFSANALSAKFADFLTGKNRREDIQPTTSAIFYDDQRRAKQFDPILSRSDQPQAVQPTHDNMPLQPIDGHSGDDSPVGSLLSVPTPDLDMDQHRNNQYAAIRMKKKKRRYGKII